MGDSAFLGGTVFRTILIDPPWEQRLSGKYSHTRHSRAMALPYPTMSVGELADLPIGQLAASDCHLWLWTTNQFLRDGFELLDAWGFKFHNVITWVKPSGCGNYFVGRTQSILFGYRGKIDMRERFRPNVVFAPARRHSQKPECVYELIEAVSHAPRLEVFGRATRTGWDVIGNAIDGQDIREAIAERIK